MKMSWQIFWKLYSLFKNHMDDGQGSSLLTFLLTKRLISGFLHFPLNPTYENRMLSVSHRSLRKGCPQTHPARTVPSTAAMYPGISRPSDKHENENEKSTFPIHTPIIIHTSVYMSEVVVLGPRSAAFGAKSLSPLLF